MDIKTALKTAGMTVAAGVLALTTGCAETDKGVYMTLPTNNTCKPTVCENIDSQGNVWYKGTDLDCDGKSDEAYVLMHDDEGEPFTAHLLLTTSSSLEKAWKKQPDYDQMDFAFYMVGDSRPWRRYVFEDCDHSPAEGLEKMVESTKPFEYELCDARVGKCETFPADQQ